MTFDHAIAAIERFQGRSLTRSLSKIEGDIVGLDSSASRSFCGDLGIGTDFMESALTIKNVAGQINVVIHAAGILHSLSSILMPGEIVEYVSLGAGNTGKMFDLETNQRVAEFKFIDWKGGAEAIRQNGIFKDFYELAEFETGKRKDLFVVDTLHPMKFLNGGRALTSVLSKQPKMLDAIRKDYGDSIAVVRDYFELHKNCVNIVDVRPHIGRTSR